MAFELRDVASGLWLWRAEHPHWRPGQGWQPMVTSTCVESCGEIAVLDPLAPPDEASEIWTRLDEHPPTLIVVLKPDHVRDIDLFVSRYGVRFRPGRLLALGRSRDRSEGHIPWQLAAGRPRRPIRRARP